MIRVLVRVLLATGIVVCTTTFAAAGLTSITFNPSPIVVGYEITYTANSTPPPPMQSFWEWDYRCTEGGTFDAWVPSPSSVTYSNSKGYFEQKVGSYQVRCVAHYMDLSTSTLIKDVTVNGPDTDSIPSGLPIESNGTGYPTMTLTVTFRSFEARRPSARGPLDTLKNESGGHSSTSIRVGAVPRPAPFTSVRTRISWT